MLGLKPSSRSTCNVGLFSGIKIGDATGVGAVATLANGVLDRILPDKAQAAAAQLELLKALQEADNAQAATNTAEAQNSNLFVSGWRPFIGWVCGSALAYQYVIVPISMYVLLICHVIVPAPPTLSQDLWQLMFGMLGMGALRSFDKVKGVTK